MRRVPAIALPALCLAGALSFSSRAHADSSECVPSVYVEPGDRMDLVVARCGMPSTYRVVPGTPTRHNRHPPTEVYWVYKRDGSFPRILHFVGGYLESVVIGSAF